MFQDGDVVVALSKLVLPAETLSVEIDTEYVYLQQSYTDMLGVIPHIVILTFVNYFLNVQ